MVLPCAVFTPVQRIRRSRAMLLLCVASGLLLWGDVVFRSLLQGFGGEVYGSACATLAFLAALGSLMEIIIMVAWIRRRRAAARARCLAGISGE